MNIIKTENFINKAKLKHGVKYDYSKVEYINSDTKVCIICPEHGEFWQTPHSHLKGRGCSECGKVESIKNRTKTKEKFIEESKLVHGDKYTYNKVIYVNDRTKVIITCPIHGDFQIAPTHLLNGEGCRECGILERVRKNTNTYETVIERFKRTHNNFYDYSKTKYINNKTKVIITCPIHGDFEQLAGNHLSGQGCPECGKESFSKTRTFTTDEFIEKSKEIHGDKYNYSKVNYKNSETKVCIICPEHGEFYQKASNHLHGQGCKKCFLDKSNLEREIFNFIKNNYNGEIIENDRKILEGQEIDILLPDIKLGIEVNGLNWHTEQYNPDKNYHLNKTIKCNEKGYKLIHVFEDEWINKKEIIKSIISSNLNINNKIYARKCEIREIDNNIYREFITNNHLQGYVNANYKIGLYYNNELVSLMSFSKNRKNLGKNNIEGEYELVRFCNKINTNVVGGASKLLKYFINQYKPIKITSYADYRFSKGNLYEKLGFKFIKRSNVNYFYVINKERKNRFNYRKDILIKQGFDKDKSEHEIMLERKIYRIYDCGSLVYELINKNLNDDK